MFICRVEDKITSTIKSEKLHSCRFVVLQRVGNNDKCIGHPFVAVDSVGCGTGDIVLVVSGAGARFSTGNSQMPIDAAVVGLVDENNNSI